MFEPHPSLPPLPIPLAPRPADGRRRRLTGSTVIDLLDALPAPTATPCAADRAEATVHQLFAGGADHDASEALSPTAGPAPHPIEDPMDAGRRAASAHTQRTGEPTVVDESGAWAPLRARVGRRSPRVPHLAQLQPAPPR